MSTFDSEVAPEATYDNPASGETFSASDAKSAGWVIVHEGEDGKIEGVTDNATHYRAEKYASPPGQAGRYLSLSGVTEEGLLAAIQQYEAQFAYNDEGFVLVPAAGVESADVDLSDESTVEKITAVELASAGDNDTLVVLTDPEDPESAVRETVVGGKVVKDEVVEEEVAPEPTFDPAPVGGLSEFIQTNVENAGSLTPDALNDAIDSAVAPVVVEDVPEPVVVEDPTDSAPFVADGTSDPA